MGAEEIGWQQNNYESFYAPWSIFYDLFILAWICKLCNPFWSKDHSVLENVHLFAAMKVGSISGGIQRNTLLVGEPVDYAYIQASSDPEPTS